MEKKFLNGNKSAIITFIVSMCMSVILILSGIIVSIIPAYVNSSKEYDEIRLNTSYTLDYGENVYEYDCSIYDKYDIYLPNYSYIDSVVVKEKISGQTVYTSTSYKTYHSFYLNTGKTYVITIVSRASSATFRLQFN
ncbi:MAG: hypothetical protein IKL82_06330 [Clostridia bacterium]|nr:hypothetical protein [Clostridia bacterium]